MTRRRTLDWVLIVALTGSWALLVARAVDDGLRTRRGHLEITVTSASTADGYPTVRWPDTRRTGLVADDELTAVDAENLRGASALRFYDLATRAARERGVANVSAARAGSRITARLELVPASRGWWVGVLCFSFIWLSGLVLLIWAPSWHLARRNAIAGWCFAAPRAAVWTVGPLPATFFEATFLFLGWGVGSVLTIWNAQDFTRSAAPVPKWMRGVALLTGILFGISYVDRYYTTLLTTAASQLLFLVAIFLLLAGILAGLTRAYSLSEPLERRQIRWYVLGFYIALVGAGITAVLLTYSDTARGMIQVVGAIPLLGIPLGITISVIGYRWLDVDRLISATVSYTILGIAVLGVALALAPRVAGAAAPVLGIEPGTAEWLFMMALVLAAVPAHLALRPQLDRRMFAERHARMAGFAQLQAELEHCSSADELWKLTSERVDELLQPETLAVYARDGSAFTARFALGRSPSEPYDADSLLVRALERRGRPLAADSAELDPFDRAALETLGVALVVPIRAHGGVLAFASLGPKRSGDIYTPEEKAALAAVATRCAEILRPHPAAARVFRREADLWTIASNGKEIRLRDMRGLHYVAMLLREPRREFAALDMARAASGPVLPHGGAVEPDLAVVHRFGDAGPALDSQARAEYRRRVISLESELADAERCADLARLERASAEREALLAELESTARPRHAGSDSERARVAVTKAIRAALERIAEAHPELGAHLTATIRRGYTCAYEPDRGEANWEV